MADSSLLDQQVTLADIIDLGALERVCATFARLFGARISVFDQSGRLVVGIGPDPAECSGVGPGQGSGCLLASVSGQEEPRFASSADTPPSMRCDCGLRIESVGVGYQGTVFGLLVLGPYRCVGADDTAAPGKAQDDAALHRPDQQGGSGAAALTSDEARRAMASVQEVLSVIVQSGYARHLTSQIHIAAIQDAYNELIEKNRRLADSVEKLRELDRLKSGFLATVSHELRTPLTSVIGYSEMLLEEIAGPLNEKQTEYLNTVMRKGNHLLAIINEILEISRSASGRAQLAYERFEMGHILREVSDSMIPQARRKRITVVSECDPREIEIQADRGKSRQMLLNLLSNAIKFTPSGGRVEMRATLVDNVDEAEGTGAVEVRVRDTGIGVPPESRERIFEAFYQVDNSATRTHGGTGLGLSVVKHLAEAHGGRVWLEEPDSGPGTVFVLRIPTTPVRRSPDQPRGAAAESDAPSDRRPE
jgi:two-component system sensor histidine kinase BarA